MRGALILVGGTLVAALAACGTAPARPHQPASSAVPSTTASPYLGTPRIATRTFVVDAVAGINSRFVMKANAPVTLKASGTIRCMPGNACLSGPEGGHVGNSDFVMPDAPAWGLIATAGTAPWTFIGAGPTTFKGTGTLIFSINESFFVDNSGVFTVRMQYECYPGALATDPRHYACPAA